MDIQPTDYAGLALAITAISSVIASIFSGMASLRASKAKDVAAEAKMEATIAKDESVKTGKAVDGHLTEYREWLEKYFEQKGASAEIERQRQYGIEAVAAAAALAKEATDAAPSVEAKRLLEEAEHKARGLMNEATVAATRLIAEAHLVAVTNESSNPVPVQVVGPGVDSPLKVTTVPKE